MANRGHPERKTEAIAPQFRDPVIEAYKKDIDRTILRENLKLSANERFLKFERFMEYVMALKEAGRRHKSHGPSHGA